MDPRRLSSFPRRIVCTAVAATFGTIVCAQPAGLTVVHGGAAVTQQGAQTTITTVNGAGTRHSVLDWQSFGVPVGTGVFFAQPDAASTSINRVLGGNPSGIYGTLGSNGRLVLVNPAGIAVGAGAVVATAGFTASTLPMSTADAIAGRLRFGTGDTSASSGVLQVDGQVLARQGDVVLVGPQVQVGPSAVVQANGDVILAAGRKAELTGRGLEGILLEVKAPDDRAVNLGTLRGDSVGIFASHLRHSGVIEATAATVRGGRVVLRGDADTELAGAIRATTPDAGGSVQITGDVLVLRAGTTIDVSQANGGGEILLGGGWHGQDARIANARLLDVEEGVQLKADATLSGNGGTVVAWSDDTTVYRGTLSARGAGAAGAGGTAEVSGKRQLVFRGKVELGAASGRTGNLLLDPDDVTIQGGSGDGSDLPDVLASQNTDLLNAGGLLASLGVGPYTIYQSEIEGMDANISIQANKSITASGTFGGNALTIAPNRDLQLQVVGSTGTGIDVSAAGVRVQGTGQVTMTTTGTGQNIKTGDIGTAGGSVTLSAPSANLQIGGALATQGGAVSLAGQNVSFQANQAFAAGTQVNVTAAAINNTAAIDLGTGAVLRTNGTDFANKPGGSALSGTGTVDLTGASTTGTFNNDGTLRPGGANVGDLTIQGHLKLMGGSHIESDVAGGGSHDRVLVSGQLTSGGALAVSAPAPAQPGGYTVVQVAGAVSGGAPSLSAPAGMSVSVQPAGIVVAVAASPSPPPGNSGNSAHAGGNEGRGEGSDRSKQVPARDRVQELAGRAQEPVQETDHYLQRTRKLSVDQASDAAGKLQQRRVVTDIAVCRVE